MIKEPKRRSDKTVAQGYITELRTWIKECIASIVNTTFEGEVEVKGLGDALSQMGDSDRLDDIIQSNLASIKIIRKTPIEKQLSRLYKGDGKAVDNPSTSKSKTRQPAGHGGPEGDSAAKKGNGTRRRKSSGGNFKGDMSDGLDGDDVLIDVEGDGSRPQDDAKSGKILFNSRTIKINTNTYRTSFVAPEDISDGYIELYSTGDNGKNSTISINDILIYSGCSECHAARGKVRFKSMCKNARVKIEFTVETTASNTIGVNIYANS